MMSEASTRGDNFDARKRAHITETQNKQVFFKVSRVLVYCSEMPHLKQVKRVTYQIYRQALKIHPWQIRKMATFLGR